jgi:hypothetical protein
MGPGSGLCSFHDITQRTSCSGIFDNWIWIGMILQTIILLTVKYSRTSILWGSN